jgi:hypothetical protein
MLVELRGEDRSDGGRGAACAPAAARVAGRITMKDKTASPKLSKTAAAMEARIRGAERAEEQATKSAKSTLIHYFGLAVDDMTGDMTGEIETLVEDLIAAAAQSSGGRAAS